MVQRNMDSYIDLFPEVPEYQEMLHRYFAFRNFAQ